MAIKVLKKTVNIELCHALLRTRLNYDFEPKYHIRLRQGQSRTSQDIEYEDVAWAEQYGFWMFLPDPWQDNAFGICGDAPSSWESLAVTCKFDFNPAKRTGAFGRDEFGGILLLHTGAIEPTATPQGRAAFWEHYQGQRIDEVEHQEPLAVVAHLGSLDIARQLQLFLEEVARIRAKL